MISAGERKGTNHRLKVIVYGVMLIAPVITT